MKHSELLQTLQNLTNHKPTQSELGKILGKATNSIGARAMRDSSYYIDEIKKINDYFNIDLFNQTFIDDIHDDSGEITVDYYPEVLASCGNGTFELSQVKEKIKIPRMCIRHYFPLSQYSVVNAYGDSMLPAIQNNDKLVVEMLNGAQIRDNNIYIFFYDDKIFVKRLVQNVDSIAIISDNPDKEIYPTRFIEKEAMNDIHLIGRIVGLIRTMN